MNKHARAANAINVTGVISEEDTTERGKGTDEVGLPSDWCFDTVDIRGRAQSRDTAFGHDSGLRKGQAHTHTHKHTYREKARGRLGEELLL